MIIQDPTPETLECLRYVQSYIDKVSVKMGSEFLEAYIFGELAKNDPPRHRPLEVLFTFREAPIKKYKVFTKGMNGLYAKEGRDLNHIFHADCTELSQYRIASNRYNPIKPYFYYPNVPIEKTMFILTSVDQKRCELIKSYGVKYPEDISNTLAIFG